MASKAREEETWIDIQDLREKRPELILVNCEWHQISCDRALELIHNQAYSGFETRLQETYFNRKPAIRYD